MSRPRVQASLTAHLGRRHDPTGEGLPTRSPSLHTAPVHYGYADLSLCPNLPAPKPLSSPPGSETEVGVGCVGDRRGRCRGRAGGSCHEWTGSCENYDGVSLKRPEFEPECSDHDGPFVERLGGEGPEAGRSRWPGRLERGLCQPHPPQMR